ncbi:hypothetical protein LS74_001670 [Helicobacter magdeburgensis]|uniref:Uncharacterized protein n=1 Tax=Helicobacter magdeburgensis TaxID=471858 RepID=A0A4U8T213_9HELI|nr:hypothetical protein LS74_001670 [Helicobacter magdeburgensis]
MLEVSKGLVGFQAGCIQAYDDVSAILDEPILIEFAEKFVRKLEEAGLNATALKDTDKSDRVDTYCAVVFGKEIAEALDYMLSKGCYELMQKEKK